MWLKKWVRSIVGKPPEGIEDFISDLRAGYKGRLGEWEANKMSISVEYEFPEQTAIKLLLVLERAEALAILEEAIVAAYFRYGVKYVKNNSTS